MNDFALFPNLPLELQDKVWEAALPPPAPTAFHVQLARHPMGRTEDGSIDRYNVKDRVLLYRLRTSGSPHLSDRDCVMSTLFGMLFACHRSYRVATRALKFIKPSQPFLLRGGDSSSYTLILRGGDSLGAYHMEVDAMRDLVILNTGWQWPCRLISTAGVFRLHVPTPLRCLALAWPGPHQVGPSDGRSSFYNSEALNGLLTLWGSRTLRALYVVVDPAHLREAEKPWPAWGNRWSVPMYAGSDTVLEDYLASFEVDTSSQTQYLFQRGNRRYFEVSAEQVARSGGLGEVVELLESARRRLTPTVSQGIHQEHLTQALESETVPCRFPHCIVHHLWRDMQAPCLVFRMVIVDLKVNIKNLIRCQRTIHTTAFSYVKLEDRVKEIPMGEL